MPLFQSKESTSQEENGEDEDNQQARYVLTMLFTIKSNHCFDLKIQNMQSIISNWPVQGILSGWSAMWEQECLNKQDV